jgi:hypothetical protein
MAGPELWDEPVGDLTGQAIALVAETDDATKAALALCEHASVFHVDRFGLLMVARYRLAGLLDCDPGDLTALAALGLVALAALEEPPEVRERRDLALTMRASTTRRPARTAATSESELVFVFVGVVWSEKGGYVAQRRHDATRFMAQVQGPVSEASGDRRRGSSISASVVAYLNVHLAILLLSGQLCVYRRRTWRHVTQSRRDKRHVLFRGYAACQTPTSTVDRGSGAERIGRSCSVRVGIWRSTPSSTARPRQP